MRYYMCGDTCVPIFDKKQIQFSKKDVKKKENMDKARTKQEG